MQYHKIILAGCIAAMSSLAGVAQPPLLKWVVEKNSSLIIDGKSNVNSFTCNVQVHAQKDTIVCQNGPGASILLTGEINIAVSGFDCNNRMLTKDLRKTMKAAAYPQMLVRFISLETMPLLPGKNKQVKGLVEVELAGKLKRFELDYSFSNNAMGYTQLNSSRNFFFSDFNLSAPHKLLGLIKVKDVFAVSFQLILRKI